MKVGSREGAPPEMPPRSQEPTGGLEAPETDRGSWTLLDFSSDGYLLTDRQGIILEANAAAAMYLETRKDFLRGKPFPLLLAQDHRRLVYSFLAHLHEEISRRGQWSVSLHTSRKGPGALFELRAVCTWEPGRPSRVVWVLHDLTEQARLEQALAVENAFGSGLLDAVEIVGLLLDVHGRVQRSSAFVQTLTGLDERDLGGQEWRVLLPVEDRPRGLEMVGEALVAGASKGFLGGLLARNGRRSVAWSARSLPARGKRFVLITGHDVTDLQRAQQQALQAERLAAIGQVMAALAHESRNLLQASQACLERLGWRLEKQPEALDLLNRVQQAQYGLTRLFEDVRSYAAPLTLDLSHCHLGELWREVWSAVCASQSDRECSLTEDVGKENLICEVDRFRMSQVFRNVLENSFAACEGPVRVTVFARPGDTQHREGIHLTFRDNGPGLTQKQRQRIFEPFFTTRPRGSGLGMAIARRIVEAHGGEITAGENALGAQIHLFIPRKQP